MSHLSKLRCVIVTLCLIAVRAVGAAQDDTSRFAIFWRGDRIGFENVTLTRTAAGWRITSTGNQMQPGEVSLSQFDVTDSGDWHPQTLALESILRGQLMTLTSTFAGTTATNDQFQGGQKT